MQELFLGRVAGFAAGLVVVVSWSIAPALASRASAVLGERFSALGFNAWRNIVAVIVLVPLALVGDWELRDPWHFAVGLLVGTLAGSVVGDYYLVKAIGVSGAGVAVPASYSYVVWTSIVGLVLGRSGPGVAAAAAIALVGVAVSAEPWRRRSRAAAGVVYGLLSSLSWTAGVYGFEEASRAIAGPGAHLWVALLRSMLASAVMAPWAVSWLNGFRLVWRETVAASLVGYVAGYTALSAAVGLLGAPVASVLLAAVPAVAGLVAIPVAGERPGKPQVVGGLLVALGIALASHS